MLLAFCASCGGSSTQPQPTGTVIVVVTLCRGGPSSVPPAGLTRTVIIEQSGRVMMRGIVHAPFRFRFVVRPGTYLIVAKGDQPASVRVIARRIVQARLVTQCHMAG